MIDEVMIKRASEKYIESKGGDICDWLPFIDIDEVKLRNIHEIIDRALILNILVNISFNAPIDIAKEWIINNNLMHALTENELKVILSGNEPDQNTKNNFRWYLESLWVAAWLGGMFQDLNPIDNISNLLASWFPSLKDREDTSRFRSCFKLRSEAEVYEKLDLFYRSHWHVKNAIISGGDLGLFKSGIVEQRRHMLEWVLHSNSSWDEVNLNT